jgi:PEP-CTERM motif
MVADALGLDDEFYTSPATFGSGWQSNGPAGTNGKFGLQHPDDQYYERDGSHQLIDPFDGNFIGFVNMDDGDGFDQEIQSGVLGNLTPGMKYILKVAVGARPRTNHDWNDVQYDIMLVSNPTPGDAMSGQFGSSGGSILGTPATTILSSPTSNAPDGRSVQDLMYMFTATTSDPYAIRIAAHNTLMQDGVPDPNAPGAGGTDNARFTQGNWDNVRLWCVPEPASIALAGFAIFGIFSFRHRWGA